MEILTTALDVIRFLNDYVDNYSEEDDVKEAIFEKLFGLATKNEIEMLSLTASNDDLRSAAEEHMEKLNPSKTN